MKFRPTHRVMLALSCVILPETSYVGVISKPENTIIRVKKLDGSDGITINMQNDFIMTSAESRLIYFIASAIKEWRNLDLPKTKNRGMVNVSKENGET